MCAPSALVLIGSATLRLVDSKVSKTGVFMGTYELAGEVVTGTF